MDNLNGSHMQLASGVEVAYTCRLQSATTLWIRPNGGLMEIGNAVCLPRSRLHIINCKTVQFATQELNKITFSAISMCGSFYVGSKEQIRVRHRIKWSLQITNVACSGRIECKLGLNPVADPCCHRKCSHCELTGTHGTLDLDVVQLH
ncbi:hypothetical protein CBL_07424 [Carabus blaptoides fortunei]